VHPVDSPEREGLTVRRLLLLALPLVLAGCSSIASQPVTKPGIRPLQVKPCQQVSLNVIGSCSFDNPIIAGDLVVVAAIGSCNATTCNTISDSQGNTWQTALTLQYYNGQPLWYTTAKAGSETIFFAPGAVWAAIIAEYPSTTGLDDANDGYYGPQNLHPNGAPGSSDIDWARPVEAQESCELLIGWSDSGIPDLAHFQDALTQPTAGPNFTIRAQEYGWLTLEDETTTIPGLYIATLSWNSYGHWMQGGALFKMGGCK
jgi:hypothetical protein